MPVIAAIVAVSIGVMVYILYRKNRFRVTVLAASLGREGSQFNGLHSGVLLAYRSLGASTPRTQRKAHPSGTILSETRKVGCWKE